MIKKTQSFVLSNNPYKTSSMISSLLTNNSIIDAICYKAKKNSKVFGSDLESISKLNIVFYDKKDNKLSILKEASIIKNYKILEKSIYSSLAVFYIRETLLYCAKDFDNRYFILMEKILDALEKLEIYTKNINDDKRKKIYLNILIRAFEMKTIHIIGISPHLDKCIICENKETAFYSILEGGVICNKCRNVIKDSIEISEEDKNFMKIIKYTKLIDIINDNSLKYIYDCSKNNVRYILEKSIFNYINRTIKSKNVLEEILFN